MNFDLPAKDLTGVDLLSEHLGPTWDYMKASITPENAERFVKAYNLLSLNEDWAGEVSDVTADEFDGGEEDTLGMELQHILIDESLTVPEQTQLFRELLANNIIDRLVKIGLTFDFEYLNNDHFDLLYGLYDIIFTLYGYEDSQSLSAVLEDKDVPGVDRYLRVYQMLNGVGDSETEPALYWLTDVSESLLDTLRLGLISPDLQVEAPDFVKERIVKNREFLLDDTLAGNHVKGNGRLGMGLNSILSFYNRELMTINRENAMEYIRELIAFVLISEVPNDNIVETIKPIIEDNANEIGHFHLAEKMLQSLTL